MPDGCNAAASRVLTASSFRLTADRPARLPRAQIPAASYFRPDVPPRFRLWKSRPLLVSARTLRFTSAGTNPGRFLLGIPVSKLAAGTLDIFSECSSNTNIYTMFFKFHFKGLH